MLQKPTLLGASFSASLFFLHVPSARAAVIPGNETLMEPQDGRRELPVVELVEVEGIYSFWG